MQFQGPQRSVPRAVHVVLDHYVDLLGKNDSGTERVGVLAPANTIWNRDPV